MLQVKRKKSCAEVQCREETWCQQGTVGCRPTVRVSVGDDAGGRVGLDHSWACKDAGLYPKNIGKPLRKDFRPTVTRPLRLGREHSSV